VEPEGLSGYHPEPAKDLPLFVFDKNRKRFADFTLDGSTLLTVPERSRRERGKRLSMTKVPFSSGLLV
jgi:hypothetical protein